MSFKANNFPWTWIYVLEQGSFPLYDKPLLFVYSYFNIKSVLTNETIDLDSFEIGPGKKDFKIFMFAISILFPL